MRVAFKAVDAHPPLDLPALRTGFAPVAGAFGFDWQVSDAAEKPRVLIAVSKGSHCLNDLLHRWQSGNLDIDIAGAVSNHPDLRRLAE